MRATVWLLATGLALYSVPSEAQSCQRHTVNYLDAGQSIGAIRIIPGGNNYSISAGTATALSAALTAWNSACGSRVPELNFTSLSPIPFYVNYLKGTYNKTNDRDRCAITSSPAPGNRITHGTVHIFETTINGADCTGEYPELTMHEIGHALGLRGNTCSSNIMRENAPQGARVGHRPDSEDCNAVDDFWLSNEEPAPGSPDGDDANEDNQCVDECGPGGTTPIVISLVDERYELTPIPTGVVFDIDADGSPDQVAWTVGGSDDAFLVLDRNSNGFIDDGSELFGGVTPQPASAEPNGFAALAVFDALDYGGDLDGYLTSGDAVFDLLRLWLDDNHNGFSDPGELLTLSDAGILFIDLAYGESRKVDDYGNEFRYWSLVGREHDIITAWDVILLHYRW